MAWISPEGMDHSITTYGHWARPRSGQNHQRQPEKTLKPDPEAYKLIESELGAKLAEVLFVSSNLWMRSAPKRPA